MRALLGAGRTAHRRKPRTPRSRYGRYAGLTTGPGAGSALRPSPAGMAGRWSALPARDGDVTRRALAAADVLLDRYGVVTRGSVGAERITGGFSAVYPVLKAAEESGRARRGYFVEGLGAAQFALPGAVDRLRSESRPLDGRGTDAFPALVLAATDPANPYGAALPWPEAPRSSTGGRGHQPARKAGALVVLIDGACVLYVERGGRTLLSFTDDPAVLQPAADALALAVRDGALGKLQVERADGVPVVAVHPRRGARGGRLPADAARPAAARLTPPMPEGDTVWLTARRLHQALAGRPLAACDFRVPALATVDLRGSTVTEVIARGKHILTRLEGDLTVHSHLRMDGSWYLSRAGSRARRLPEHMIRVQLGNAEWLATGYRVHDLRVTTRAGEAELVGPPRPGPPRP